MSLEEQETGIDPVVLRAELKAFENAFREQQGRKPSREDIKKDATIQSKYKLFQKLTSREPQSRPAGTTSKSTKHSRVEKPTKAATATPKRTPSKKHATILSPVPEAEPTPAFIRNALGPTPHRDGQVLGIFDIAIENTPLNGGSPSKSNGIALIAGTPSKTDANAPESGHTRTPQSSSKRFFHEAFAGTPLKRKRDENDIGTTSSSKRKFATPSFLRRSAPLAPIAEDNTETTSFAQPFRRRGLVRSLSSIIQGLKKQEEKRMDDDWDVMNEIEEEEANGGRREEPSKVQVEDSQPVDMPLGPDRAPESDEEDSDHNTQETGRKPWKKKGLKRQTRRVNMKPVLHKAKKVEETREASEDEEDARIAETQLQDGLDEADELGEEDVGSGTEYGKSKQAKKRPAAKGKAKAKESEQEEPKKKGRKVNPEAHANYRALKIKNKNSKAGGRGRKFGRR